MSAETPRNDIPRYVTARRRVVLRKSALEALPSLLYARLEWTGVSERVFCP